MAPQIAFHTTNSHSRLVVFDSEKLGLAMISMLVWGNQVQGNPVTAVT